MAANKSTTALRISKLLAGVQKRFPTLSMTSFPIGGSMYTLAQIIALIQPVLATASAAVTARAAWQTAVQAERVAYAQVQQFVSALRAAIYVLYGNQPDALSDFGLAPRKTPKPRTAAVKAVAVAKNLATREARNTKGKKQKLEVHGSIGSTIQVSASGKPAIVRAPPASPSPSNGGNGSGPTPVAAPANGNSGPAQPAGGSSGTH